MEQNRAMASETQLPAEAVEAARALRAATGVDDHDVAVVLGSGWRHAATLLGEVVAEVSLAELPGFAAPTVEGHGGSVVSTRLGEARLLVFTGRSHFYESRDAQLVVHGVRTAVASGCRIVVLTSASGGIREGLDPGTVVLISDQINLTGESPLRGAAFLDLGDLYSARLRSICRATDPSLVEGTYAGYWGPNYETPAEIRAYRTLGADVVGMSTVLEAIAAHAAGAEVVGISLVTNRAAGLGGRLSHDDVVAAGALWADRTGSLLGNLLPRLTRG